MDVNFKGENIIRCQVSTVASSIVSNITGFAKDHMESIFPKDYFKDIFISTSLSSSEWMKSDDNEINVKKTPIMSITPNYIVGFNNTSFGIVPKWRRGIVRFTNNPREYREVFVNDYDRMYIWAVPSRFKVHMNYKIKVDTYMEKIDIAHFLSSKFQADEKFFINDQLLESEIPQSLILAIANIKEYDLENSDDVIEMIEYLNQFSSGYLTRKRNLSTGNEMYSFLYSANILMTVEDPPNTDGGSTERTGMVDENQTIDFTLGYEVWAPTYFIFQSKELPPDDYYIFNREAVNVDYTMQTRPPKARGNRYEIAWSKFVTNQNESVDELILDDLLEKNVLNVIKNCRQERLYEYLDEIFEIMCFKNNRELVRGEDYDFSWKNEKIVLKLKNVWLNYVYSVGIYANKKLLQEEILKLLKKY